MEISLTMQGIRDFAVRAHGAQRYGDQPYVVHLDAVAAVLASFGYEDVLHQTAAYFHDIVEDTDLTVEQLKGARFNPVVVEAVSFCTDDEGANRQIRKRLTFLRWRRLVNLYVANVLDSQLDFVPLAIRVKLADRMANVEASIKAKPDLLPMYLKERDAFYLALYAEGVADEMFQAYNDMMDRAALVAQIKGPRS